MGTAHPPTPIHIFKPGRHTTMAGEVIEFSEAAVAATAAAYNPALHEAPLVIGHPKTDDPAQGWVQSLAANERGLFALPRDVGAEFAESVGQRRYAKVSAKFYSPDSPSNPVPGVWYLRHVGFLGAQPPGVKGLDNPAFAESATSADGCVCFQEAVEFGDWSDRTIAGLFRGLRDWFIGKFGQDEADKALPGWDVNYVQEQAVQPDPAPSPAFAEPRSNPSILKPPQENAVTPEQAAQLAAENAKLKEQLAQQALAAQLAQAEKLHGENVAFAERLVSQGKLAPKAKGVLVSILDLAATPGSDGKTVEFAEGDTRQPLTTAIKALFEGGDKVVEFGEVATKDRAATPVTMNPLVAVAEARAAAAK